MPPPRARPSWSRVCSRPPAGRSTARSPSRSTSGWSRTPVASCTPTPRPRRTGSRACSWPPGSTRPRWAGRSTRACRSCGRDCSGAASPARRRSWTAGSRTSRSAPRTSQPPARTTPTAWSRRSAASAEWTSPPSRSAAPTAPRACRCGPPTRRWTSRRSPTPSTAAGTRPRPASPPTGRRTTSGDGSPPRSGAGSMAEAGVTPLGCWLVDKPAGPTSHDVVARIRGRLGRRTRVGHAGTLDPFATGLLVVLVGRATRLARYLSDLDKTYRAAVRFGATSPTGDPEGPVEEMGPPPERAAVERAVAGLVGPSVQRVPAFAAVKVGGQPLYRSARRGEAAERPERPIVVHEARLEAYDAGAGVADLVVRCSKGTYLRQIAVDLGEG